MLKQSAKWQLLHLLADWHAALTTEPNIHSISVDISEAFNQVDHGLLLVKLEALGVMELNLIGLQHTWKTSIFIQW